MAPSGSDFGPSDSDPRRTFLSGRSSREILQRIWTGDPLGVVGLCTRRLRERMLMVDATRLLAHGLARIAHDAAIRAPGSDLDAWLAAEVDLAIDELLREDWLLDRQGVPVEPEQHSHYDFLCKTLGLPQLLARKACVVFNTLPDEKRHALWAILVEGRSFEAHALETGRSEDLVRHYFEEAALLFMTLGESGKSGPGKSSGGKS